MGHNRYYRGIRTTAERRANCEYYNKADREDNIKPIMCRPARNPRGLPNAWNDYPKGRKGRGWKAKGRKTQYRLAEEKGHKHVSEVVSHWARWKLACYFEDHDIPYRVIPITEKYTKTVWQYTEQVVWLKAPRMITKRVNGEYVTFQSGYVEYRERRLEKPRSKVYTYTRVIRYRIIWWAKNDTYDRWGRLVRGCGHEREVEKIIASFD